ncbi:bifunctional precorrin-2 dehydrogenase/sirohydrochlorin ferrochelatase [Jhaorihella thermophila]
MDYLPIFLNIRDRRVVVDGGTTVAARRAERALDCGAQVVLFDPHPGDEVLALQNRDGLVIHHRVPDETDMDDCAVAWGASEDDARDTRLSEWCRARNIPCNIADRPDLCDFITPSIVDRSPIVVAISTGAPRR